MSLSENKSINCELGIKPLKDNLKQQRRHVKEYEIFSLKKCTLGSLT